MVERRLRVFGAQWCADCLRAKWFFDRHRVPYEWVDIEGDPEAREYVRKVNKGKQIVPTIVFPDGSVLVEPSNAELAAKMGIH